VRTVEAAFSHVETCEIIPGEWLILARHTAQPLDDSLIDRLEARHTREVLARTGWDWSIVMSLQMISSAGLSEVTAEKKPFTVHSGALAYSAPLDTMRWGPKFEERRDLLVRLAGPLGNTLGETEKVVDIARRLSDVKLAQQVVADHPDQYWAYRNWLKKQLQDHPRSKVIQVKGEGLRNGLHPEDTRRKEYLAALGKAIQNEGDPEERRALVEYATPYDPLVAPFIDREIAVLEKRSPHPDIVFLWESWVRSSLYASPNDHSVRNVCEALDLLVANPSIVQDSQLRWDYLNGLLQILEERWSGRVQAVALRFGINDAEVTLRTVRNALAEMDRLHADAGVSDHDWNSRRAVLSNQLVDTVRTWRSQQSVQRALATGTTPAAEEPTDPDQNPLQTAEPVLESTAR
jgi:hypothetical protein